MVSERKLSGIDVIAEANAKAKANAESKLLQPNYSDQEALVKEQKFSPSDTDELFINWLALKKFALDYGVQLKFGTNSDFDTLLEHFASNSNNDITVQANFLGLVDHVNRIVLAKQSSPEAGPEVLAEAQTSEKFTIGTQVFISRTNGNMQVATIASFAVDGKALVTWTENGVVEYRPISPSELILVTVETVVRTLTKGSTVSLVDGLGNRISVILEKESILIPDTDKVSITFYENNKLVSRQCNLGDVIKVHPSITVTEVVSQSSSAMIQNGRAEMGDDPLSGLTDSIVAKAGNSASKIEADKSLDAELVLKYNPSVPEKLSTAGDSLSALKFFVDQPITAERVATKSDYYTKVLPELSAALMQAGYPTESINALLAKSIENIDFKRAPQLVVDDINRIISNFYKQAVISSAFVIDVPANSENTFVPSPVLADKSKEPVSILNDSKVTPGADSTPFVLIKSMRINAKDDPLPEQNITDQVAPVAAIAEMPTEITALENVPNEKGQNGLDLYSSIEEKVESKTENSDDVSNFQEKFKDLLDKESFTPSDYVKFVNELHTTVRSRYDEVIVSAEKNLQRYSSTYTPSATEKEALQFLSSLRARYAAMQAKESETGILRAEVINSPDNPDSHTNADDVRKFTEKYSEKMIKVLSGIAKLEGLIATSITETKPLMSETYQLQLETLRVSGNQVLSTLPENHELYEPFKNLIESRLTDMITNISDTTNGNRYFISNYTDISIVRDKIKAAVSYLKTEQEFSDYKTRAQARLAKIKTKLTLQRTDSTESQTLTQEIVEKVEQVNLDLATPITLGSQNNLAFAVASSVEASVKDIKDLETKIKVGLAEVEKKLVLLGQLDPAKESTSRALIEDASVVTPENFLIPKILEVASASNRLRSESVTNRERVKKLLSYFTLTKISRAAVLAAAVAWPTPTGTDSQAGSFSVMSPNPFVGANSLIEVSTAFSKTEISEYLRSVTKVKPAEGHSVDMVAQPSINSYQPSNLQSPRTASERDGVFVSAANQAIPVNAMPIPRQSESEPSDAQPFIEDVPVYQSAENSKTEDVKHTITKGDIFWNIAEGETAVGMLPVMQEINSKLHQKIIDIARMEINKNHELRTLIGGFDETKAKPANHLIIEKSMNITELDKLMRRIAKDRGYL